MAILNFKVKGMHIYELCEDKPVTNSIGFIDVCVTFDNDDEWGGLSRWITFKLDNTHKYQLTLTKNTDDGLWYTEESLDLDTAGTYKVSVHGTNVTGTAKRIPTEPCRLVVRESGAIDGEPLTPGTPTAMEQIDTKASSKVGYIEYSDTSADFYTDSSKEVLIKSVPRSSSTAGGITLADAKTLVESYGYATTSSLSIYAKSDDVYTKSEVDAKDTALSEAIVRLDERVTDLEDGGTSGASWTAEQITLLKTALYCMEFSTEAKAEAGKTAIDALIDSLSSGETEVTVSQNGSVLTLSGFTATSVSQSGSVLTLA